VFTPENQRITETYLNAVDDSSIDYTLPLAGEHPVSSAVVLCFRTQIFITRSDVVLVSGIHHGEPEIVGRYDSLGNPLEA
ncbi:YhfX family PLP-dependent enzyme, partial [Escherichia coli]